MVSAGAHSSACVRGAEQLITDLLPVSHCVHTVWVGPGQRVGRHRHGSGRSGRLERVAARGGTSLGAAAHGELRRARKQTLSTLTPSTTLLALSRGAARGQLAARHVGSSLRGGIVCGRRQRALLPCRRNMLCRRKQRRVWVGADSRRTGSD